MRPRWHKVWRDASAARGRLLTAVVALGISGAGVITMLGSYVVLAREVPANYLSTHPADALLELEGGIDSATVARVRRLPDVTFASATALRWARLPAGPQQRLPLLLFVVPDFRSERLNTVRTDGGAWPPPPGAVLIERSAMALTGRAIGDSLPVTFADGHTATLAIAGQVHEPALAPAWQEQAVYGFVEERTLSAHGVNVPLDRLKLQIGSGRADPVTVERTARVVADSLTAWGIGVHEIRLPPARQHPHQTQMNAVIRMLLTFSVLALVLGAVLAATIISALLAQHRTQIAVLKTIGASTAQVAALYVTLVCGLALLGLLVGLPLGVGVSNQLLKAIATLLNLELVSTAWPAWVWATLAALGLLVPVGLALLPILAASRRTVRDALDDRGAIARPDRFTSWLTASRRDLPALTLAARNLFRRRARSTMNLLLLAGAGAMCLTSLNLRAAWTGLVDDAERVRRYDLDVRLSRALDPDTMRMLASHIDGVTAVEPWVRTGLAVADTGRVRVTASYPDGGHGTVTLFGAPAATVVIAHELTAGRWLRAGDRNAVVLNDMAAHGPFRGRQVGDSVRVLVDELPTTVQVVGMIREPITGGAAYMEAEALGALLARGHVAESYRVAVEPTAALEPVSRALARALADRGITVTGITTRGRASAAQGGHVAVLVAALGFIAVVMTVVSLLGLSSSLGIAVAERTRELGVLRAIGATPGQVQRMVVFEGVALAGVSWVGALAVSTILSGVVARVLASISAQPLAPRQSVVASALWLVVVLGGAALVSVVPARRAARMSVREAVATA